MTRKFTLLFFIAAILLALAVLGGLVWANTVYARNHPSEKDFLLPWLGVRTFLQYGISPYDPSSAQRAQILYYQRLAVQGEDPLRLAVPFPILVLYFPFALVADYSLARGLWMAVLEIALAGSAFFTLQLSGWKAGRFLFPAVLLFSLLGLSGSLSLVSGSGTPLVTLAIVASLVALRAGKDELAGGLLILPLFKPDIAGVFVLFLLWWAIAQRRGRLLGGFLISAVLLFVFSFLLLPSWLMPFLQSAISHSSYNPGLNPGGILASWWPAIGRRLGWALAALVVIALLLEWRMVRGQDFRHFQWTACLSLAATPLIGIPTSPVDLVVLFIPLILFLSILAERWSRPGRWGVSGGLLVAFFVGQWLIAGLTSAPALKAILILGLPLLLMVGLYWMRWWAIRPPRTWIETIGNEAE